MSNDKQIWKTYPLLGTMWKTKNSRFHAADRLRVRSWWKGIALSILSAYVLVLSVIPKFIDSVGSTANRDYVGLTALAASIIILVFSVISIFDEDRLRYNYLHDNAREIAAVYHKYKLLIDESINADNELPDFDKFNSKYQAAIKKCSFNHDTVDWLKTTIDIRIDEKEKIGFMLSAKYKLWMFYDIYFWPICSIATPPILFYLLLVNK